MEDIGSVVGRLRKDNGTGRCLLRLLGTSSSSLTGFSESRASRLVPKLGPPD